MNSINEQTLVLRFRDLSTAKGDTINLHQEVIAQKGEVWWGWWKGGADSDCEEAIYYLSEILADERSTSKDHILTLFLLDTGQDRLYSAKCKKILSSALGKTLRPNNTALVPEYYRARECPAWFLLSEISKIEPDSINRFSYCSSDEIGKGYEIESAFNTKVVFSISELSKQRRTLWFVRKRRETDDTREVVYVSGARPENFSRHHYELKTNSLLWISDIHADYPESADCAYIPTTYKNSFAPPVSRAYNQPNGAHAVLSDSIKQLIDNKILESPSAVLVSGDFTYLGNPVGFNGAHELIAELRNDFTNHRASDGLLICPGNHDTAFSVDMVPSGSIPLIDSDKDDCQNEAAKEYVNFYQRLYGCHPNHYLSAGRKYLTPSGRCLEIVSLNSVRLWQYNSFNGHGFLGEDQLIDAAKSMGWDKPKGASIRIAMMHHHLLPTCNMEEIQPERASSVVYDAGSLINWLKNNEVDILLHGHKHRSFFTSIRYPVENPDTLKLSFSDTRELYILGIGSPTIGNADREFGILTFETNSINYSIYNLPHDASKSASLNIQIELPI